MVKVNLVANPNFYQACASKVRDIPLKKRSSEQMFAGGKFIIPNSACKVENLNLNFAVILQSLEKRFAIQIPVNRYGPYASEQLNRAIKYMRSEMKKSYDGIVGIIAGGHEYDPKLACADASRKLIDTLANTMDENRIPFTMLAEQKGIGSGRGIDVYAYRDDIDIYNGVVNDTKGIQVLTQEDLQRELEKMFNLVELSDKAPVSFVDDMPRWVQELGCYVSTTK